MYLAPASTFKNWDPYTKDKVLHEEEICVACWLNKTDKMLIPCKHKVMCSNCIENLKNKKCPWCREEFTHAMKV